MSNAPIFPDASAFTWRGACRVCGIPCKLTADLICAHCLGVPEPPEEPVEVPAGDPTWEWAAVAFLAALAFAACGWFALETGQQAQEVRLIELERRVDALERREVAAK